MMSTYKYMDVEDVYTHTHTPFLTLHREAKHIFFRKTYYEIPNLSKKKTMWKKLQINTLLEGIAIYHSK